MPIAITDEQESMRQTIARWAARTEPPQAVRGQEPTGRGADWHDLADLGLYAIAVPEAAGGADGSVVDLAAALEACAEVLAGGPLLPTTLASLLLAGTPAGDELLPKLAAGQVTVAVALPGARAVQEGVVEVGPVLCAGQTTHLLVPVGGRSWCLVETDHPSVELTPREPVDFSRGLAGVRLAVPPERCFEGPEPQRARELAATLYAAEAAGVAAWCLRTATGYAKLRQQFGRPIGSFQAVKHLCAGMLCRLERASAAAWDAARAVGGPEHPLAAAVAASIALDAAVDDAKDCVQVLGGIGFTWEHDAHLYLRRALALRQ
ncbi:MAG: acyl-CoA dehydrogenase family protein, partial [Micromonosporaceae bacterium]